MSPQPIDSLCIRSSILPIAPDEDHTIGFRHAGYPVEDVILLKLRAYDRLDGGLHHATALTACGIIAGNTWNGYLSLERGGEAIELGMDGLLSTGREYWFHIPHPPGTVDTSEPYVFPICPSFSHWKFPHGRLPLGWRDPAAPTPSGITGVEASKPPCLPQLSNLTGAIRSRDVSCRISAHFDASECAHLVPRNEIDWFKKNGMVRYNQNKFLIGQYLLDDVGNAILLRKDLHSLFDDRKFAFVPKPVGGSADYVSHGLLWTSEFNRLYHNTILHPIPGVRPEFLLARFAWSIFPAILPFLYGGKDRLLIYLKDLGPGGWVVESVDADRCELTILSQKSRSSSPEKRQKSNSETDSQSEGDVNTYPGHSRVLKLKQEWLKKQRPEGFKQPWEIDRDKNYKEWLLSSGVEIMDSDSEGHDGEMEVEEQLEEYAITT
ncbi:MAG: hypothetical protein M1813_005380 [Trichoglossum hirsutum]|nr:MAG: hypothetical protein M1813_005380 [Trichoglossum hirsutum]